STSPSSRSRRRRTACCASSRSGGREEREGARSPSLLDPVVVPDRRRRLHLLRAADADLDGAAHRRLARRVQGEEEAMTRAGSGTSPSGPTWYPRAPSRAEITSRSSLPTK